MRQRFVPLLLLPVLLTGCAVGPDYVRPESSAAVPDTWVQQAASQETAAMTTASGPALIDALPNSATDGNWKWWAEFGDATLNTLVTDALKYNNDLATAAARVLEARALHGGTQSARWPTLEIGGNAVRAKSSEQLMLFPASPYANAFDVSGNLRYEVDLWGRLSRGKEAALATLIASEQDRRAVAQGLISDVVRTWLMIRELHLQVALTDRTVANFQHNLTTVRDRYERGIVSALDVHLASQNLAAAQSAGPLFRQQLAEAKRRLEIIVGRYPAGDILASDLDNEGGFLTAEIMPEPLAQIPAGLPSDLLDRRPDLQAAELRLHSSVARIGEAKAALYPRISLTAAAGTKSNDLSELFTKPTDVWSLAGNLFMPLLNRGATQAQIKAAEARAQQATANYRKTVLIAFGEVENALDQDIYQSQQEIFLADSAEQARRSVELAQDRYRRGLDNLLVTLESQRRLFNAESQLLSTQRARRNARVNLILALGGPWQANPAATEISENTNTPAEGAQP